MEIKKGDKVKVSKDAPKLIFGGCDMSQIVCTVCCVDKDVAAINMINDERTEMEVWIVPTKYLVKVDAEADANEERQEMFTSFSLADKIERNHILHCMRVISQDDFLKEINPAEHEVNPKPRYVPKIMFNTEFWVKYEADLAHDLAVQMVKCNRNNYDKIGNMAVRVAKSVVENLKKK